MPPKKDQAPIYIDGPKWIGQWMMGYIHTFKTGSWSVNLLSCSEEFQGISFFL